MKSRPMTWLLLALVVAVWTVVVRRIVSHPAPEPAPVPAGEPLARPGEESDPAPLALDYRDPFLGEIRQDVPPGAPGGTEAVKPEPEPEVFVEPPPLRFKGVIRRGAREYAILENGGRSSILSRGDTLARVRVLAIDPDSVVVRYEKQRFTLTLQ